MTIARADVYADALTGAVVARDRSGPILLTAQDGLSPQTADEIRRLGARSALLLGGEAALSARVRTDLEGLGLLVERIGGANRFATAAMMADALGPAVPAAYLAEGGNEDPQRGWPDALAVSHLAAATGRPILLTGADRLPDETRAAVQSLGVESATVVGGEVAVGPQVVADLEQAGAGTLRLAGARRYETGALVYEAALAEGLDPSTVWLATGTNWPDALSSGPVVGALGQTFLLVDPKDLDASIPTREVLAARRDEIRQVRILGGPAAVSERVLEQLRALLQR